MSNNYSQFGHPKGHAAADGSWVRNINTPADGAVGDVELKLAVDFNTADAAVLYTVPAGRSLVVESVFYDVSAAFTGGTSSAIGVSSNGAAKGSILGGASGDVLATLTAGVKAGTKGTALAAGTVVLPAGTTVKFDRITSAFTAGSGFIRLNGKLVA
jgi:hypothetical protein